MLSQLKSVKKGDGQLDFGFPCVPSPWAAANMRLREILQERRELARKLIARVEELEKQIYWLKNENEELRDELK